MNNSKELYLCCKKKIIARIVKQAVSKRGENIWTRVQQVGCNIRRFSVPAPPIAAGRSRFDEQS